MKRWSGRTWFNLSVLIFSALAAGLSLWAFPHVVGHGAARLALRIMMGLSWVGLAVSSLDLALTPLRTRRRLAQTQAWWQRDAEVPIVTERSPRPPARVKWSVLPILMLAWAPLLHEASSLWPVLLGLMTIACWQQSQSETASKLRAVAEQLGWLIADLALIVLFPRTGEPGTLSLLGLAAAGSLAWMMLVARNGWRLLWAGLFVLLAAVPIAARILRWDWLLWIELALALGLLALSPALTRIEKAAWAPWPQGQATQGRGWARAGLLAAFVAMTWWTSGLISHPSSIFSLDPVDLNDSGPKPDGGSTIVFAVRIGKEDDASAGRRTDTSDWYWRGNVLYTLDGSRWSRPETEGGYNAPTPYPARVTWKDPALRFYMITWAGPLGARVWLDRPIASDTIMGGDVALPPEPSTAPPATAPTGTAPPAPPEAYTRDGVSREDLHPTLTGWRPSFYPGIAAVNQPIQDGGHAAEDLAWALNLTPHAVSDVAQATQGPLANPRTRAAAQAVHDALPAAIRDEPSAFVHAWLSYLDEHSVYDLDRTAAGARADVADAFLFGAAPAHGTCVDFATSTVLALRQVGIPARYVTGYVGATWNPYIQTWVVTTGQAHAWVEYYQARTQAWVRADPTAAIRRVVHTNPPVRPWSLWLQSVTNSRLSPLRSATRGPQDANLLAWVSDIPLPTVHLDLWVRVATGVSLSLFLTVLALILSRRWRQASPQSRGQRRLRQAVTRAQVRVSRKAADALRRPHEGLAAWADRIHRTHPELGDWRALARVTQRAQYGSGEITRALLRDWKRVGTRRGSSQPSP